MVIKSWNQLKKRKLQLKYELELAKLETKSASVKLEQYKKPAAFLDTVVNSFPTKNTKIITTVAGLVLKLFFKKK